MIIEYQVKRFDLVKAFFYNLRYSQRTKLIVFGAAFLFFVYSLYIRYRSFGHLSLIDFILAVLYSVALILAIPALSFITAKTELRSLSINPEGLETKIGSKDGKILWKVVAGITSTQSIIIITSKKGNVFSIPTTAFKDEGQRQQFIGLATQYHADANRSD